MTSERPSATARADIYGFLSRLFIREIDDAFAAVLVGAVGRALLPTFAESDEVAAVTDRNRREALLDSDFVHLTIVNLVPYESFYRRTDAMMETSPLNPVSEFLRRWGFEPDLAAARAIAPDHLGIELEFMAALCMREAEAEGREDGGDYARQIRSIERDFLSQHLLAWAPIYLLAVERNAKTILYRDGADAALDFLLADADALRGEG